MKKNVKKIWLVSLLFILTLAMSGCNSKQQSKKWEEERAEQEETQSTEASIQDTPAPVTTKEPSNTPQPEPEVNSSSESQEELPSKSIIEYGDKINISYTKTTQELQWEYTGMQEFQVATTAIQFQNEFDDSEEAAMKQVEKAMGKTVGDTFTLWFEGGDGRYGYEYTIVEVKSQNPDIAEYGDKILTDYSMTHYGVDTCEGETVHSGQLPLHLLNTNVFFAIDEDGCCSLRQGDLELKKILGKTIGDRFESGNSYYENSFNYKFTIKEISKAVKYGDTIVAEVRAANTFDAKSHEEYPERDVVLDLMADYGIISLDGESLSLENGRTLYKELIGKKAGDRVFWVRENKEKREVYNIMIQGVSACERDCAGDMEVLLAANEDEIFMFYQYFSEYEDYFEYHPELYIYSEPALRRIVIDDRKEQMVYEYSYFSYSNGVDCHLTDKYEYTSEYDEKGRLLKETIRGSEWSYDRLFEYKYNEQGNCIEIIEYMSAYEKHYYYDDMGKPIKAEYISDDNIWNEEYFY